MGCPTIAVPHDLAAQFFAWLLEGGPVAGRVAAMKISENSPKAEFPGLPGLDNEGVSLALAGAGSWVPGVNRGNPIRAIVFQIVLDVWLFVILMIDTIESFAGPGCQAINP